MDIREQAVMRRLAISHACRGAVLAPDQAEEFASLFAGDDDPPVNARELTTTGFFSVLYGLGEWPFYDARAPARWAAGLVKLWDLWAHRGAIEPDVARQARASLARPLYNKPDVHELMGVAA